MKKLTEAKRKANYRYYMRNKKKIDEYNAWQNKLLRKYGIVHLRECLKHLGKIAELKKNENK